MSRAVLCLFMLQEGASQFFPPGVPGSTAAPGGVNFFPDPTVTLPQTVYPEPLSMRFIADPDRSAIQNSVHKVITSINIPLKIMIELVDVNLEAVHDPDIEATVSAFSAQGVLINSVAQYSGGYVVFENLQYLYHPYLNGPHPNHNHILDRISFRIDVFENGVKSGAVLDSQVISSGPIYVYPSGAFSLQFSVTKTVAWPFSLEGEKIGLNTQNPNKSVVAFPTVRVDLLKSDGSRDLDHPGLVVGVEVLAKISGNDASGAFQFNANNKTFEASIRPEGSTATIQNSTSFEEGTAVFDNIKILYDIPRGLTGSFVLRFFAEPGLTLFSPFFNIVNPTEDNLLYLDLSDATKAVYTAGAVFYYDTPLPEVEVVVKNGDGSRNFSGGVLDKIVVQIFPDPNDVQIDLGGGPLTARLLLGGSAVFSGIRIETHGPMRFMFIPDLDTRNGVDPELAELARGLSTAALFSNIFTIAVVDEYDIRLTKIANVSPKFKTSFQSFENSNYGKLLPQHPLPPIKLEVLRSDHSVFHEAPQYEIVATAGKLTNGTLRENCVRKTVANGRVRYYELAYFTEPVIRPNDTEEVVSTVFFTTVIGNGLRPINLSLGIPHTETPRYPKDILDFSNCQVPEPPNGTQYTWLPLGVSTEVFLGTIYLSSGEGSGESSCILPKGDSVYVGRKQSMRDCFYVDFMKYSGDFLDVSDGDEARVLILLNNIFYVNRTTEHASGEQTAHLQLANLTASDAALLSRYNDSGWIRLWVKCGIQDTTHPDTITHHPLCVFFPLLLSEDITPSVLRQNENFIEPPIFDVPLFVSTLNTTVSGMFHANLGDARNVLQIEDFDVQLTDILERRWNERELIDYICAGYAKEWVRSELFGVVPVEELEVVRLRNERNCKEADIILQAEIGLNTYAISTEDDKKEIAAGFGFINTTATINNGVANFTGVSISGWTPTLPYQSFATQQLFNEAELPTDLFLKFRLYSYGWAVQFDELKQAFAVGRKVEWVPALGSPFGPPPEFTFSPLWDSLQIKLPLIHNGTPVNAERTDDLPPIFDEFNDSQNPFEKNADYWHISNGHTTEWIPAVLKTFLVVLSVAVLLTLPPLFAPIVPEIACTLINYVDYEERRDTFHARDSFKACFWLLSPGGGKAGEALQQVVPFGVLVMCCTLGHIFSNYSSKSLFGWTCRILGENAEIVQNHRKRVPRDGPLDLHCIPQVVDCKVHTSRKAERCPTTSAPLLHPPPHYPRKAFRVVDGVVLRLALFLLIPLIVTAMRNIWEGDEILLHQGLAVLRTGVREDVSGGVYTAGYLAWCSAGIVVLYVVFVVVFWAVFSSYLPEKLRVRQTHDASDEDEALSEVSSSLHHSSDLSSSEKRSVSEEESTTQPEMAPTPPLDARNMGNKVLMGLSWGMDLTRKGGIAPRVLLCIAALWRVVSAVSLAVLTTKKTENRIVLFTFLGIPLIECIFTIAARPWLQTHNNVFSSIRSLFIAVSVCGFIFENDDVVEVFVWLALLSVVMWCIAAMFWHGKRWGHICCVQDEPSEEEEEEDVSEASHSSSDDGDDDDDENPKLKRRHRRRTPMRKLAKAYPVLAKQPSCRTYRAQERRAAPNTQNTFWPDYSPTMSDSAAPLRSPLSTPAPRNPQIEPPDLGCE